MTISDERAERAAAGMYGANWNGPEDKRPGEKMKDVWRRYARAALAADADAITRARIEGMREAKEFLADCAEPLRVIKREAEKSDRQVDGYQAHLYGQNAFNIREIARAGMAVISARISELSASLPEPPTAATGSRDNG